jgi:hypothetical protein
MELCAGHPWYIYMYYYITGYPVILYAYSPLDSAACEVFI